MGNSCSFAHSDLELREQPNLLKTDLCFRFMRKGRCSKGTSCTFAHGREELRVATQHEPERVNSEPMKVNLHRALEAPLEERALSVLDPAPLVPPGMSMVPFRPPPGLEEVLPPPSRKPPSLNDLDSLSLAPTSLPCTPAQSSLPCTPGQSSLPCTPGQYSLPCTPGQKGQQSLRREHGLPSINSESVYSA